MITSQTTPQELEDLILKIKESLGINSPRKFTSYQDQYLKVKSGEQQRRTLSGQHQSFKFNGQTRDLLSVNDLESSQDSNQISREMQTQIVKLITIAETLTHDFKHTENNLNEQLEKNDSYEKLIQEYEREIVNLKRGNDEEKQILLQFEQDFSKNREEINTYREELRKLRSENNQLKREMVTQDQEAKEKNDLISYLKKSESQLADQIHSIKADMLALKKSLESEKTVNSSYVMTIKALEDSNATLKKQAKHNQEHVEKLILENLNLVSQVKNRDKKIDEIEAEQDILKKCYEQKVFTFQSSQNTPFTERKNTLQTEMSDFIDCSANQSKLQKIEEIVEINHQVNNDSMIFNDENEIQQTPQPIEMLKGSSKQKNSRNINALCNELSSSMIFEGKFGTQKQKDILNDSCVNESFFNQYNQNTLLDCSRLEFQMVTPSQSKPASRKQSKNLGISAHRRRNSSKHNRENIKKVAEAKRNSKKKGIHFDPDKQFKKYLKKCYADVAFRRYESILTNHAKIDVARLKEKYAGGQTNSSESDQNTHTDSSSISCKEELGQRASQCQTESDLPGDDHCRCRLGEIIEERTQKYTNEIDAKSSNCMIF